MSKMGALLIERMNAEREREWADGCRCGFAHRMVGDGCEICNPGLVAEIEAENEAEGENEGQPK